MWWFQVDEAKWKFQWILPKIGSLLVKPRGLTNAWYAPSLCWCWEWKPSEWLQTKFRPKVQSIDQSTDCMMHRMLFFIWFVGWTQRIIFQKFARPNVSQVCMFSHFFSNISDTWLCERFKIYVPLQHNHTPRGSPWTYTSIIITLRTAWCIHIDLFCSPGCLRMERLAKQWPNGSWRTLMTRSFRRTLVKRKQVGGLVSRHRASPLYIWLCCVW